MSIILGTGKTIFKAITGRDTDIIFPLTNSGRGLVIGYDVKKKEHDLLNYSTAQRIDGYKLIFDLSFEDFVFGDTMMKFKALVNSLQAGNRWNIYPRSNNEFLYYEILWVSDNFEVANETGNQFHKRFKARFITKRFVSSIDRQIFIAPD
jgi:hypothetical protein